MRLRRVFPVGQVEEQASQPLLYPAFGSDDSRVDNPYYKRVCVKACEKGISFQRLLPEIIYFCRLIKWIIQDGQIGEARIGWHERWHRQHRHLSDAERTGIWHCRSDPMGVGRRPHGGPATCCKHGHWTLCGGRAGGFP